MLRRGNVGVEDLRRAWSRALPRGYEPPVVTGSLPLSPRAKRAVNSRSGLAQARQAGVSTRLLVRALLDDPESAVRWLRACGADIDQLERFLDEPIEQAGAESDRSKRDPRESSLQSRVDTARNLWQNISPTDC